MPYFVIQVKSRCEGKYVIKARPLLDQIHSRLVWPRRKLQIRRNGVWYDSITPIFPGYLFLESKEVPSDLYLRLKKIPDFFRFLQSNQNIIPLSLADRDLLTHFLSFGETVDKSRVYFDVNNKICAVSGPLKGLEGQIVKVDKRKGRAKVRLNLYKDSFLIDFGFEDIEKIVQENQG